MNVQKSTNASVERPEWLKKCILIGNQFSYTKQSCALHNFINLSLLALLIAITITTLWCGRFLAWYVYLPCAIPVTGTCIFGIATLVVHESSHLMFIISLSKKRARFWNTWFGRFFVCITSLNFWDSEWLKGHREHHLYVNETNDPQNYNITTGSAFIKRVLIMAFPFGCFLFHLFRLRSRNDVNINEGKGEFSAEKYKNGIRIAKTLGLVWMVGLCSCLFFYLGWAAFVAYFMGLHYAAVINEFKGSLEHGGILGIEVHRELRSRTTHFYGRRFFFPFNIGMHFEHHLNSAVPWYLLPAYEKAIQDKIPKNLYRKIYNFGFKDFYRQIAGARGPVLETAKTNLFYYS